MEMSLEKLVTCFVLGFVTWASMSMAATDGFPENLHYECSHTRYPNLCVQTLMGMGSGNQNADIISDLVNKTISETKLPSSYFAEFGSLLEAQDDPHSHSVKGYCEELMSMSLKRLDQALKALKSPRRNKNDIQTWLSASLTFQQTCKDYADAHSLKLSAGFLRRISKKMEYLSELASNPLALINRITGMPKSTKARLLLGGEEEQKFPKWVSGRERKLLQASTIKANVIVAQDGSGNYKTVSQAIHAASGSRFVIYVKQGVYKEKIHTNKDGITLIGDGKYSTIIVGDESVNRGTSLSDTATFTITGDGFIARDIGFHNNAGPQGEQAVALNIASDHSVIYRCSIASYQDSLYALAMRQFYRECDIYGTIDFIFGNAAAVFQSCNLVLRRPHHGAYNVILANGRSDPGQNTGFTVQKCTITTSSDFSPVKHSFASYLGRPWKYYSRAVVMESTIDDAISSRGWIEWPGYGSSVLRTLYFAEYANEGRGAATGNRAKWPGFHVIGVQEAVKFTVSNFIGGNSWIPSTGVTFVSGLH